MYLRGAVKKILMKHGTPEAIANAAILGMETWPSDCEDAWQLVPPYMICDWCGRLHRSIDHDRKAAHFINNTDYDIPGFPL